MVSWDQFRQSFPDGKLLSRDTGYQRDYGHNPYAGYDRVDQSPFLFKGTVDRRLPPMERVVAVSLNGETVAYPFPLLQEHRVVSDSVGGTALVVFFQPGTVSALEGRALRFTWRNESIVDDETGSHWDVVGHATSGPLAGKQLNSIVHGNHFWFAWAAFQPTTRVFGAQPVIPPR
jgi:hypothetical protein